MSLIKIPYSVQINNFLLLLLALFLTISIYITDVIIVLLFLSWLISGNFQKKICRIIDNPIIYSTMIFFIYFLIRSLLIGELGSSTIIQKQSLILLLPVLYTLDISKKYVEKAKYFFIIGIGVNICLSLFTFIYPSNSLFKKGHYENNLFAHGFLDHFDYSIFLCFSILLIIFLSKKSVKSWIYYIVIIILLIVLLNSYGRIGILALFIFVPTTFIMSKSFNNKFLSLFGVLIIIFSYYFFPPFQNRVNQTIANIKLFYSPLSFEDKVEADAIYLANKDDSLTKEAVINKILDDENWMTHIANKTPRYETSLGKRFIYTKNSFELISKKPFWGYGVGKFQSTYEAFFKTPNIKHPHNNFIFICVELGFFGLLLVMYVFFTQIRAAFNSKKKQLLKLIFPLFFLFIMFFDNYFLNHNTLTFFCLFSFIIHQATDKIPINNKLS